MRRALAHPYTPWIAHWLLLPAFLLSRATDSRSLAVALIPGLLLVWTAYRYATNRNQAFTRFAESQATEPKVWMLLTASVGRRDPPEVPQTKADELNARMPVAMGLGVWGLVVTGIGIAGVAHLVA